MNDKLLILNVSNTDFTNCTFQNVASAIQIDASQETFLRSVENIQLNISNLTIKNSSVLSQSSIILASGIATFMTNSNILNVDIVDSQIYNNNAFLNSLALIELDYAKFNA